MTELSTRPEFLDDHAEYTFGPLQASACGSCGQAWPCQTALSTMLEAERKARGDLVLLVELLLELMYDGPRYRYGGPYVCMWCGTYMGPDGLTHQEDCPLLVGRLAVAKEKTSG